MKKLIQTVIAVSVGLFCLGGCMPAGATPENSEDVNLVQTQSPEEGQEMAVVTTSKGVIKFVLYENHAPNTVKQFKELVNNGFYTNRRIYSVQHDVSTFLTGSSDNEGEKGEIATENGKGVKPEVSKSLWHFTGAVSAFGSEAGMITKEVLADSRFFMVGTKEAESGVITQMEEYKYPQKVIDAYKNMGGIPLSTGRYTVFGQVVEGLDVVNDIISAETKLNEDGTETVIPTVDMFIESIELGTYSATEIEAQTETDENSDAA